MRVPTVHPQNYVVTTSEDVENGNIHQHRDTNFTPTRRCIRFCTQVIVVTVVAICAIVIPLVIISTRNKVISRLTTITTTTENTSSLETTTIIPSTTRKGITTVSSSTPSDDTTIITTIEMMVSAVSSISDIQPMASVSASTKSVDSGTIETITTGSNSTTTSRSMIALNQVNDTIIGLYNTTAGESTGGFNGTYSSFDEMPQHAMDGLLTTKYLNFGHKGGPDLVINGPGIGTGFLVIPSVSNTTIACGLLFATADDNPQRDPITVTLEASNASTIEVLNHGSSWTLIYNGSTGIDAKNNAGNQTYGIQQNFSNTKRFASYRLLITSQRGDGDAVQYSEARIMGYI